MLKDDGKGDLWAREFSRCECMCPKSLLEWRVQTAAGVVVQASNLSTEAAKGAGPHSRPDELVSQILSHSSTYTYMHAQAQTKQFKWRLPEQSVFALKNSYNKKEN